MARTRVTIYCPDRHVRYDGETPDGQGIGGGVTARVRLAAALARRGHDVTVTCNATQASRFGGVQYAPLDEREPIEADILILHTTGDRLDLRPIRERPTTARLRIVLVDGTCAPRGLRDVGMDCLCACSNFIRRVAVAEWQVPARDVFVSHHGVDRRLFGGGGDRDVRDPFRIAYATHPSKGLAAALAVLRLLRRLDTRFSLHVFGGRGLWGQTARVEAGTRAPGVTDHGLVGQRQLAARLMGCGSALYLQSRPEPFGIAIAEALAAGAIPVASPVGAHPELIDSGRTGFLVDGNPADPRTHRLAAERMLALAFDPGAAARMRPAAQAAPLEWDQVACAWEQYWTWRLDGRAESPAFQSRGRCPACGGGCLRLADGDHCRVCGTYAVARPVDDSREVATP